MPTSLAKIAVTDSSTMFSPPEFMTADAQPRSLSVTPAWRVPASDSLSRLLQLLGRKEFERELMGLVNQVLPIDHCVFEPTNLIDKVAMVGRWDDGGVLCNFYRASGSGLYSPSERACLAQLLPPVTALISAHARLANHQQALPASAAVSHTRGLVHTIIGQSVPPFDRLTVREREVCERVLLGFTSMGIGLDLSIASSSVHTYRRRAYQKLGIGSQNELFSLCLRAAEWVHPRER